MSTKFHLFQNPAQALSYRTAGLTGAVIIWQMSSSGLSVSITVECGEIYVAVVDPGDGAIFGTSAFLSMPDSRAIPFRTKVEAVWLRVNNRM